MMASYILFAVCVHAVRSYSITGTIQHDNGTVSEVTGSNYIDGEYWSNTRILTLDRLAEGETLPALTLATFKSIETLNLTNIALENVPVFVNTSIERMYITGNKIKSVPANAFSGPRPRYLDLSKNEIQNMADRSVNVRASAVHLSCNKLSNFSQSWFEDPGSVEILVLDGNRIEYLQDRAFDQMTKLDWLYLGYNHLTSIGSEAFNTGITHLYLQFNDIAQLTTDMFAHRDTSMSILCLHHNQLSFLPEALLLKLKPTDISLFGNPWQCQCLRDIERWLRAVNSTLLYITARRGEPVCVVPVNFQSVCIPAVDKELQETYARALSPVQECWATGCQCNPEDKFLVRIIYKIGRIRLVLPQF